MSSCTQTSEGGGKVPTSALQKCPLGIYLRVFGYPSAWSTKCLPSAQVCPCTSWGTHRSCTHCKTNYINVSQRCCKIMDIYINISATILWWCCTCFVLGMSGEWHPTWQYLCRCRPIWGLGWGQLSANTNASMSVTDLQNKGTTKGVGVRTARVTKLARCCWCWGRRVMMNCTLWYICASGQRPLGASAVHGHHTAARTPGRRRLVTLPNITSTKL